MSWLRWIGLTLLGVLVGLWRVTTWQRDEAREEATEQEARAEGEEDAREAIQETVETARKVDDDVERASDDELRRRLREYAKTPGDSD